MGKYSVDVLAFRIQEGETAAYKPFGDEEWYYLDSNETWRTADRKTLLPEVEIAGWTAESVTRMITRAVATIAKLQEHGGTAIIFARDFKREPGAGSVWAFVGSVVMTCKTGKTVQDAVKLFDRNPVSTAGMPMTIEVDDFTLQSLDLMDEVEAVHES